MTEKDEDNERNRGGDMKYVNSTIVRQIRTKYWEHDFNFASNYL